MEALPSHERVILVGHNFGGLAISQAMEYFPSKIYVAVFVTGLMARPTPNISTLNQMVFTGLMHLFFFFLMVKVRY